MGDLKSPFDQAACPPPSAGEGFSGTPGGPFDVGSGESGLQQSPWTDPVVPIPTGAMTPCADLGGPPIRTVDTGGGTHQGESQAATITPVPNRTIDQ